jgi:hypothetical protein
MQRILFKCSLAATALAAASFTLAALAVGCGQHTADATSGQVAATPAVAEGGSTSAPAASAGISGGGQQPQGGAMLPLVASADSLPPEVSVSIESDQVTAGEVVLVAARASSDVSQVLLRDPVGRTQPFEKDATTGVWRTFYRVPMKDGGERIGLSVTALNGSNRWHRVWTFLTIRGGESVKPDSVDTP